MLCLRRRQSLRAVSLVPRRDYVDAERTDRQTDCRYVDSCGSPTLWQAFTCTGHATYGSARFLQLKCLPAREFSRAT